MSKASLNAPSRAPPHELLFLRCGLLLSLLHIVPEQMPVIL
jgi:hypothetical protein